MALTAIVATVAIADREPAGTAEREPPTAADHVATAECDALVAGPSQPAGEHDLVAGPVILRGARLHARRDRKELRPKGGRDGGAKAGLVLEAGNEVVVSIHPEQRRYARLTYTEGTRTASRVRDGNPAVRFRSCWADAPTGWPGGFVLSGPRCVRVSIAVVGGPTYKRRIAFGRGTCG